MTETAKFCDFCSMRLSSITPRTEAESEFYKADHSRFRTPLPQAGRCENCGREAMLTHYQLPASHRVTIWD
jgi:hypothetical protein